MKECFTPKTFSKANAELIVMVNGILDEYRAQGYVLTLRQLYYQLVSRDIVPNNLQSYSRVGSVVSDARLAGLVDWAMIEDRGREVVTPPHWNSPAEIVEAAARQFSIDKWQAQSWRVEVMVEKQALEGILIPVCRELDVPFTANRGYSSSSALYEAGKRIKRHLHNGLNVAIMYLGDHDPSGIDMTRDVRERLELFSGDPVEVQRLALNYDQVVEFNPPENPAKTSDSRAAAYIAEFGPSSWELDAIEPRRLAALVTDAVTALRDPDLWQEAVELEQSMRAKLLRFAETYDN